MERPLWDRIQEIYHSTLPIAPAERSAFVASACAHDQRLLHEVNSLLHADESSGDFLQSPVFEIGLKIITSSHSNDAEKENASSITNLVATTIDDRYLIEKKLGQGGMGEVYLARDLNLHNRPVVIKILSEASLQNSYVVQKFRQEVEALSRIDHPGVVAVLGAGKLADAKPYIVMQYVSGLTLRSQIPSEGMDLARAALILEQIGAALDYVHEKGIFHRDLKPDNIMLQPLRNSTELVKIVDFGIAKVKDSVIAPSTVDKVSVGTAVYMSPEQLRGEKITAAGDIYSMGVIAYELVTGRRPFNPTSAPQLLELQRAGVRVKPVDLRANVSTEAQAIILRGLSFERAARYQNAAEFGDSLARALMNEDETARMPTGKRPLTEPPPSKPDNDVVDVGSHWRFWLSKNRFAVISALAVLVCIGVLFVIWPRGKSTQIGISTPTPTPTPSASPPTRSLTYSLTVQKMRNGRPYENSFQSNGDDIFETGYKFRLNVSTPDPGYVYLFNEGSPEPQSTSFTIIYPTPAINNGSASIGAKQRLQTNWNTFGGQPGTENFWIVWSTSPVSELELAKSHAFKHRYGGLTGEHLHAVKDFLMTKESEVKVKMARDKDSQVTTLRGAGDVLVKLVEFKHR